jgi:hypothetical protein
MAITIYTEEQIANQALAFLRNRFTDRDSSSESFLGKLARMFGMLAAGIQKSALDADNDSVPNTKNSTSRLEEFAYVFGVPSSTVGSYGRKAATPSGGGAGLCTGTLGTSFPADTQLLAPDGITIIKLVSTVTIAGVPPGAGSVAGAFSAVTAGTQGNLAAGTILTWITPPTGSDNTVTLTTGLSGAFDEETDQALLTRILERLQQPPKGGTASDYRQWAEAIQGVSRAYVYPLRGGLGSVHVSIVGPGSGTGRDPGATVKTNVDDYINGSTSNEGLRPVTVQGYTSFRPYLPGSGLNIRVRVVVNGTSNAYDWNDAGASLTVTAYTAPAGATPAKIELSSLPASLSAAITAGSNPRLQVLSTGASAPVNEQVRVASIDSGTIVNLESPLPSGFIAPNATDLLYAGGPVVDQIAQALLDYVDSLGPSRASGYASALDVWEDTVAISRLIQVTLDQVDTNGIRLCNTVQAGGATIGGGSSDIEATDTTSSGPELLFARWISVTQ